MSLRRPRSMTPRNFEDTSRATHVMPLWLMELPLSAATVWLVLETAGDEPFLTFDAYHAWTHLVGAGALLALRVVFLVLVVRDAVNSKVSAVRLLGVAV